MVKCFSIELHICSSKCVFKADLYDFSKALQVTLDGSAFHTAAAAWTNVQSPTVLRDLETTRVLESAELADTHM